MNGKVSGSVMCDLCQNQLGMKVTKLMARVQNNLKATQKFQKRTIPANSGNMGAYDEDH